LGGFIGGAVILALAFRSPGYGEESVKEYYEDGKLKSEETFKNGKPAGGGEVRLVAGVEPTTYG